MTPIPFLAVALAANATAAKDWPQAIVNAVHELVPFAEIASLQKSAVPGFYEVVTGSQVAYVSEDGRFLIPGSVIDIASRKDLTEQRMMVLRRDALAKVPKEKRIVFAPENPKYTVSVFTDPDCGYCRTLHAQIAQYNALGIAIEYLWFPRAGVHSPSFDKAVSVWCADDRRKAFSEGKADAVPAGIRCDNPVAEEFDLAQRMGLNGTPSVIASDGSLIGGYLTPQQMLEKLEGL